MKEGSCTLQQEKRPLGNKIFKNDPLQFFSFLEGIGKWEKDKRREK